MHLGYHELRNMLAKFKEEREKRKAAGGPTTTPSVPGSAMPAATPPSRSGEYRSSRDEFRDRDRDRGYDRHPSSRYE